MLATIQYCTSPRLMHRRGQRNVDGVDVQARDDLFIAVRGLAGEPGCDIDRTPTVACRDRHQLGLRGPRERWKDGSPRDIGAADHSEPEGKFGFISDHE